MSISENTFTMPDADVTVEGLYNVFAQRPSFKRTYESASNNSGTISFKLNGSPDANQTALVQENSEEVVSSLNTALDTGAQTDQGEWKCNVYNNGGNGSVSPDRYRVRVKYGNYTFYSDVFTVKYAAPAASVADVIVSGSAGTPITDTSVTVTLENDTFVSPLSGNWITNLPDGLSQSVTRTDERTATITITGTPQVASTEVMKILIPAGALVEESGTPVEVDTNSNAKFNITSNAPTADKIVIGGTAFPDGNPYYKNGTNGAFGGFTGTSSDYNAKYDPATGTLTLNGYDGPCIWINGDASGDASQTVIVKLAGGTNNTVTGNNVPAIQLSGGVNLIVTADADANLTLTGGTSRCAIGPYGGNTQLNEAGSVTISGKANVTISASAEQYITAYGILSGKDVTIEKNASLSVECKKAEAASVTAYGIKASGKVTVDTTGTVDINVSGCGQVNGTYCIEAASIAFKNAEAITLKYVPFASWGNPLPPTSPKDPTTDRFDASGMKTPTTATDSETGVTTVTYAKKGARPAAPTISADKYESIFTAMPVTLTCTTPNVVIYYTTDGTDPTDSSTKETYDADNPFNVTKSCTVKAIAYSEEDRLYSDVVERVFKWKRYGITHGGGGKAYSDSAHAIEITQAEPGTTVYLLAPRTKTDASTGKELIFSSWKVVPFSVSVQYASSYNQAYFIMPGEGASVTAIYIDKPAGVTVSGTAVSWNDTDDAEYYLYPADTEDTTIRAQWKTGGTVSGYSYTGTNGTITATTVDGKTMQSQTFSFSTVPADTYKLVIFKPGKYVPKIVTITVGTSDYTCGEQKLWLYGDVNYDGAVNSRDATQIFRADAGNKTLTSEEKLAADVNCDGSVNSRDALQIFKYDTGNTSVINSIK